MKYIIGMQVVDLSLLDFMKLKVYEAQIIMNGSNGDRPSDNDLDLIDFNSTSKKCNTAVPLIPGPESLHPVVDSNPFDTLAIQAETDADDPFEVVFKSAFFTPSKNKKSTRKLCDAESDSACATAVNVGESETKFPASLNSDLIPVEVQSCLQDIGSVSNCKIEVQIESVPDDDPFEIVSKTAHSTPFKKSALMNDDCLNSSNAKFFSPYKSNVSNGDNNHVKSNGSYTTIDSKENSSCSSLNLLNEDVFKDSIGSTFQKSSDNTCSAAKKLGKLNKQNNNQRSVSLPLWENLTENSSLSSIDFTSEETVRASAKKRINRIQQRAVRSFNNSLQSQSPEESNDFNKAFLINCSSAKSSAAPETPLLRNLDLEISINDVEDDVFAEAKKLSNSVSEMDQKFDQMILSDESENLMSVNLQWQPLDSSDEEYEKLRNDPALNLKFKFRSCEQLSTPKKPIEFSDAVIEFIKRRSRTVNSSLSVDSSAAASGLEIRKMKKRTSLPLLI